MFKADAPLRAFLSLCAQEMTLGQRRLPAQMIDADETDRVVELCAMIP